MSTQEISKIMTQIDEEERQANLVDIEEFEIEVLSDADRAKRLQKNNMDWVLNTIFPKEAV